MPPVPRIQAGPHIQLSRGNQLRVTLALGPDELNNYADDLALRADTYQQLLDKKIITLRVNKDYEHFTAAMEQNGVKELASSRATLDPEAYRQKSARSDCSPQPGPNFSYPDAYDRDIVQLAPAPE